MAPKQIDCFNINFKFLKVLGVWPSDRLNHFQKYYTIIFLTVFIFLYDLLITVNFFYMPKQLDSIIGELLFYFTELNILAKALTFLYKRNGIKNIFNTLENDIFQPETENCSKIVQDAKLVIVKYFKISALLSYSCHIAHVLTPFIIHIVFHTVLELPVCSYDFIPAHIKDKIIYPIYLYQSIGIQCHMLYNVNIDGFFLGLMIFIIAQLEVLDVKLRRLTDSCKIVTENGEENLLELEKLYKLKLDECIIHFDHISKFCDLIQDIFSVPIFVQFSMSSCIICVCLFEFTLPAPISYYIFLSTYMAAMTFQIFVPCWFGSRIAETSSKLSVAAYFCDWTTRSRQFKSNMRLFVERMNEPLSLTGMKMFQISLTTFTSIINTAYSFFTLLRHMQTQE